MDVDFAGLNFADVMARRGDPGYVLAWPYVPGKEVAGRVREVGKGVRSFQPGDRVAAFLPQGGGLAEVAVCSSRLAAPVGPSLTLEVAAIAPLLVTTGVLLLEAAAFKPEDSVMVHSASGGIGAVLSQLIQARGGRPCVGTVSRADKAPAARAAGYEVVHERDEKLIPSVMEAAPDGLNIIFDPLGTEMLSADLEMGAIGARIVLYGNPSGLPVGSLPDLPVLMRKNLTITGFSATSLALHAPSRFNRALHGSLDLLASGMIKPEVSATDLGQASARIDALASGESVGKHIVALAPATKAPGKDGQRAWSRPSTSSDSHGAPRSS